MLPVEGRTVVRVLVRRGPVEADRHSLVLQFASLELEVLAESELASVEQVEQREPVG